MALKAGRVGVNPSQVDMAGNVIGAGGDTYTKLEIDQMLGSKVGIGQLEANNKDFYFAYDATSQKYGYKLDNEGDFHPFEEAGGSPGWNKPANLTSEGLTFNSYIERFSGGYEIIDGVCYLDIIIHQKSGGGGTISGLPLAPAYTATLYMASDTASDLDGDFISTSDIPIRTGASIGSSAASSIQFTNFGVGKYIRIIMSYEVQV